jgi:hypothetical protein
LLFGFVESGPVQEGPMILSDLYPNQQLVMYAFMHGLMAFAAWPYFNVSIAAYVTRSGQTSDE